jgi:hypothetical protein
MKKKHEITRQQSNLLRCVAHSFALFNSPWMMNSPLRPWRILSIPFLHTYTQSYMAKALFISFTLFLLPNPLWIWNETTHLSFGRVGSTSTWAQPKYQTEFHEMIKLQKVRKTDRDFPSTLSLSLYFTLLYFSAHFSFHSHREI